MSDAAKATSESGGTDNIGPLPDVKIDRPRNRPDLATILGLVVALGMIVGAITISESDANFINIPSIMIVIFGTMAATSISYTGAELAKAGSVIGKSVFRKAYKPSSLATALMDLSIVARKKGVLALVNYDKQMQRHPFLARAVQLVVDGYPADDIQRLLTQEIEALSERHKRSASIARRAAEVAPAMGLIGTLVGLVQMLADLSNPEAIGPAMAVALLTTFYGAILGTVVMASIAIKLEKNSADETMIKTLILTAATSMARQENPRRLEMLLNSDLPPSEQINYFD